VTSMSMDYPALAHAISEIRATADDLDRGRTTLHGSFGSFLGGGWTGQAADSFVGGWDDWSEGVASVLDALRSIADLLEQHGTDVHLQDTVAALDQGHLHARLGGTGGSY
jgi:WXG100 family type VII secretion target